MRFPYFLMGMIVGSGNATVAVSKDAYLTVLGACMFLLGVIGTMTILWLEKGKP